MQVLDKEVTRELLLDVETTGFKRDPAQPDPDRIIEIGIVEHINGKPSGRTFQTYINPGREVPADAVRVHGLTTEFLADKPRFQDIAGEFLAFVGSDPTFVAHFKEFDVGFINLEMQLAGLPTYDVDQHICSAVLWKKLEPLKSRKLDTICHELGIDTKHRVKHGALLDAKILSEVYVIIKDKISQAQTADAEEEMSPGF